MSFLHEEAAELFKGRHFSHEIITFCIRWYVTYQLSYRDLVEMMAERHVDLAHTPVMRWVQRDVPGFAQRWRRYTRPVGTSWRGDEPSIRITGRWVDLCRAGEREGQTVDFFLSEPRDIVAANRFFLQAIEKRGVAQKLTLEGSAASHVAGGERQEEGILPANLLVRTNRSLNHLIEPGHRRVNRSVRPLLGVKRFDPAATTITGLELLHHSQKRPFDISALCPPHTRAPQIWELVLAA